ncbi:DUF1778 domain-containing protein [Klebsiella pneumoniae]|uniref:type II toxin-antitoxin system TacA family antitoxin n=2 Tax=Klebsiella pneumoniae TaxID=573 RepID=UPI00217D77A9|nr:DUF1778 domain-containing protein [Klebsiella pneumoniae]MCS6066599.1 DUF1778 domain-containing protein [Klebsiella pneumoniae subsp. pneumoniae]MDW1226271.1 DUF1778 domain-containing protein [Klebsiella pneumoniae]MDW5625772.1 DUF1778 domain-containing protein [Klebsiella pneumoniae]MDW5750144.1 DUF1778 domain-containing protein [Klebsiella pneumoniae]MDW5766014.1 DUF1778 domain-containing protein [Klebsiella pneumoniae]
MKPDVREAPISIRVRKSQRDLIDMAASLVSKSLTDFMLEVACREAQNILLDRRLFLLNHNQFKAFIEELDAPITPERKTRIDNGEHEKPRGSHRMMPSTGVKITTIIS